MGRLDVVLTNIGGTVWPDLFTPQESSQMTNTTPGIVSLRTPIFLTNLRFTGEEHYDNVQTTGPVVEVVAVKGVWVTNTTGTDGLMSVTDVVIRNQDQLQHLGSPVTITLPPSANNIVSIQ